MHILFNATTNHKGGTVQTAVNFIMQALRDNSIKWSFAVSSKIAGELKALDCDIPNAHVFECSPARDKKERQRLKDIEGELSPDVVFTMSGPSYVKFTAPHFMGITNPYVTHAKLRHYRAGGIKCILTSAYQSWYAP